MTRSIVRTALSPDLAYLDYLQAANRHALGFLSWTALASYLNRRRVLIVLENDEPAGYFLTLSSGKIVQACVDFDARRHYLATALLTAYLSQLGATCTPYASCWCADGLDANAFWSAAGFVNDATRELRQAGRLRRMHRLWSLAVNPVGYAALRQRGG